MPEIILLRKFASHCIIIETLVTEKECHRVLEVAWNVYRLATMQLSDTSQTVSKCGPKPLVVPARTA